MFVPVKNIVEEIHKMIEDGTIWEGRYKKWFSKCPSLNCHQVKSHRNRGLAIDNAFSLCRHCKIEKEGNGWQRLRLLEQRRRREKEILLEDETIYSM